jgi:hypothetical protein
MRALGDRLRRADDSRVVALCLLLFVKASFPE